MLTPKLDIEGHFFLNIFHRLNQHRIYKNKSPLADYKSAMNSIFRIAAIILDLDIIHAYFSDTVILEIWQNNLLNTERNNILVIYR